MSDKEIRQQLEKLRKFRAKLAGDKEASRNFLVNAGIINASGNLVLAMRRPAVLTRIRNKWSSIWRRPGRKRNARSLRTMKEGVMKGFFSSTYKFGKP